MKIPGPLQFKPFTEGILLGLIIGAVISAIVASLVASQLCVMRAAGVRSKSIYATRAVIEDLDETLKRGECKLAAAKTALFRKHWQEWIDEDAYPSGWFREIINLHN